MYSCVIDPVINDASDLNISLLDMFRTGFHVIGRQRLLSHVFMLLCHFSSQIAFLFILLVLSPILAITLTILLLSHVAPLMRFVLLFSMRFYVLIPNFDASVGLTDVRLVAVSV